MKRDWIHPCIYNKCIYVLTTTVYAELLSYEVIWEWSVISSHLNPLSVWVMAVFRLLLILYLAFKAYRMMGRGWDAVTTGDITALFSTESICGSWKHTLSLSIRAVVFLSSWPSAQVMFSLFTRCFINVFINHVRWWFDNIIISSVTELVRYID